MAAGRDKDEKLLREILIKINNLNDPNKTSPEEYGAKGDGINDDSSAIQKAFDSGKPVYFGAKTYLINSPINLPSKSVAQGLGYNTILYTTANSTIFNIQGAQCNIGNIRFKGNSTGTSQNGISCIGNAGLTLYYLKNNVMFCYFETLGGNAIYVTNIVGETSRFQGAIHAVGCEFTQCLYGINMGSRAEYNTFTGCIVDACTYGVTFTGGNNDMTSGLITACTRGVQILGGTNDGHGSLTSVKINHNTLNLYILGVTKNFTFNGCHIYAGGITCSGAVIKFIGCEFSTFENTNVNTSKTEFRSCTFLTALTTTNFLRTTGDAPIATDCTFVAGNTSLWLQTEGTATLSGGTIVVANQSINANSKLTFGVTNPVDQGFLSYTLNPGVGFTINSSNALDASTVTWQLKQSF